ncbi:MAG TPA: tetratricopeptide repeat protein [Campylobacterales bacterium]|nr:tetratricopeptide repeat protein [Campylobacterales bacterium]HIP60696.1 tetratricopeptide repeat protein [Campylobacterales bacterium]
MSTLTLARIYERQGHTADAIAIYSQLLKEEPRNSTLLKAIERLKGKNMQKVSFFTAMNTKDQFREFEKWLVKPWS